MATYLVTGGAGFIGSHLVEGLIGLNHSVVVLDNLSTGHRENVPPEAEFVKGDLLDESLLAKQLARVEGCFHLAAIPSAPRSLEEWFSLHRINLSGTTLLFHLIRKSQRKLPVVYASSSAIYGHCAENFLKEDHLPHPMTPYGADKYGCELHASVATHTCEIPTLGLRLFNIYGPRQDASSPYSGVISLFIRQLLGKKPLTIYGDGEQSRDFVYVADVVNAFIRGMALLASGTTGGPWITNVCRGESQTIHDLIHALETLTGLKALRDYAPARAGDPRHSQGDPSRLKELLGMSCDTTFLEGLRKTVPDVAA